jgi:hypothetical protein
MGPTPLLRLEELRCPRSRSTRIERDHLPVEHPDIETRMVGGHVRNAVDESIYGHGFGATRQLLRQTPLINDYRKSAPSLLGEKGRTI